MEPITLTPNDSGIYEPRSKLNPYYTVGQDEEMQRLDMTAPRDDLSNIGVVICLAAATLTTFVIVAAIWYVMG